MIKGAFWLATAPAPLLAPVNVWGRVMNALAIIVCAFWSERRSNYTMVRGLGAFLVLKLDRKDDVRSFGNFRGLRSYRNLSSVAEQERFAASVILVINFGAVAYRQIGNS